MMTSIDVTAPMSKSASQHSDSNNHDGAAPMILLVHQESRLRLDVRLVDSVPARLSTGDPQGRSRCT